MVRENTQNDREVDENRETGRRKRRYIMVLPAVCLLSPCSPQRRTAARKILYADSRIIKSSIHPSIHPSISSSKTEKGNFDSKQFLHFQLWTWCSYMFLFINTIKNT
ncbi:hypothetical protein AMECASPLE_025146 [Ameca splendens]|uniref:Uncharacterized protein n=1 Tax=Ameca splendens TaxID=208324 RepID=A0ABV1AAV5_9TELE